MGSVERADRGPCTSTTFVFHDMFGSEAKGDPGAAGRMLGRCLGQPLCGAGQRPAACLLRTQRVAGTVCTIDPDLPRQLMSANDLSVERTSEYKTRRGLVVLGASLRLDRIPASLEQFVTPKIRVVRRQVLGWLLFEGLLLRGVERDVERAGHLGC